MFDAGIQELLGAARSVQGTFRLRSPDLTAASVGAALRTRSGLIFTGVSMDLACGVGFCAEHAAIAEMIKHRDVEISTIVSVSSRGVLPPCGRCRELMMQLHARNEGAQVLLPGDRIMLLRDLIPEHWLPLSSHGRVRTKP